MRIYTRSGDEGETGLFGGQRVSKAHLRLEAYGQVDELNAVLGFCAAAAPENLAASLRREMANLFVLGSHLATPPEALEASQGKLPSWDGGSVGLLEAEIDEIAADLEPLRSFILPGGCELSARLHLARTVCRRAERVLVRLASGSRVEAVFLTYLNRLGDWLFILARAANHSAGVPDLPWRPGRGEGGDSSES